MMATTDSKYIDVDMSIRINRIMKVMDETIEKLELALCLPVFLKNLDRFSNHLSDDEFLTLSRCDIYQRQDTNESETYPENIDEEEIKVTLSSDSLKESQPSTTEKGIKLFEMQNEKCITNVVEDLNVKKAIYILCKRRDLVHIAKTEYLKFTRDSPGFIFLENMSALRECANIRMVDVLSSETEREKILFYKDLWNKNDEAIKKINTLKPQLNNILSRVGLELKGKNELINEMQSRMKNFDIKFREEIEKICAESEKNMVMESKSSEERQAAMHHNIRKLDETFQNTLNGHLKREKELRVKRFKIESQLEACLQTYDNDLRERQVEYDELLAAYKDEQQQMATLQEQFDEQDKEYTVLMKEKAYEDHLELERHIEDLRRRVAARIIQMHWRALKQRRLERAKSKKAKKGKKRKGNKKGKSK